MHSAQIHTLLLSSLLSLLVHVSVAAPVPLDIVAPVVSALATAGALHGAFMANPVVDGLGRGVVHLQQAVMNGGVKTAQEMGKLVAASSPLAKVDAASLAASAGKVTFKAGPSAEMLLKSAPAAAARQSGKVVQFPGPAVSQESVFSIGTMGGLSDFSSMSSSSRKANPLQVAVQETGKHIDAFGNHVQSIGRVAVTNVVDGAQNAVKTAQQAADGVGKAAQASVKGVQEAAQNTMNGVQESAQSTAKGIQQAVDGAGKAAQKTVAGANQAVQGAVKGVQETVKDAQDLHSVLFDPPRSFWEVSLPEKIYRAYPKPIRALGSFVEDAITDRSAEMILKKELRFLPQMSKGRVRDMISDNSKNIFDALCRGKRHSNPKIRALANRFQQKISTINHDINPTITNTFINMLCASKRLPF